MKILVSALAAALFSFPVYGSGPSNLEEQIDYARESRAFQESEIIKAHESADTIFTGITNRIWKDHALRRVYVEFEILELHKGNPATSSAYYDEANSYERLEFDTEPVCPSAEEDCSQWLPEIRICVGCLPPHDKVTSFEETYRYLVYLDGDRIIRQSEYIDWVLTRTASEELEFIEAR